MKNKQRNDSGCYGHIGHVENIGKYRVATDGGGEVNKVDHVSIQHPAVAADFAHDKPVDNIAEGPADHQPHAKQVAEPRMFQRVKHVS